MMSTESGDAVLEHCSLRSLIECSSSLGVVTDTFTQFETGEKDSRKLVNSTEVIIKLTRCVEFIVIVYYIFRNDRVNSKME